MIQRRLGPLLVARLLERPAVALLGPRQAGKTTLARGLAEYARRTRLARKPITYLDLELPSERARLADPEAYLRNQRGRLTVIDEIHRMPELFEVLRPLIDERRRDGEEAAQFLVLGSASLDIARAASETLAGRIAMLELGPIDLTETAAIGTGEAIRDRLWVRGGFPDSLLADDDARSLRWRDDFVRTFLERDVAFFAPRLAAETLRRFWTMLAHHQGGLFNASQIAAALGLTHKTIAAYLDLFVDLLIVRRLSPWHANTAKRLVKAPKVYVRDSGLVHALLRLAELDDVLAHPVAGVSWEGFVIENILTALPPGTPSGFYRTAAGAEIDLVIEAGERRYAIEIKRTSAPAISKGFHHGAIDIAATDKLVIHGGTESFEMGGGARALTLPDALDVLQDRGRGPG